MMMTNPTALAAEARRLSTELGRVLDGLAAGLDSPPPPNGGDRKRADGRLTYDGVDALYADFVEGHLGNAQIAAKHDISLSAVVKRKDMWKRGVR